MNTLLGGIARWLVTVVVVAASLVVALWLWRRYETDPWTRDGKVRAEIVRVAPDVGGLVTTVAVQENQTVKKGDLLFVVDRPRYADALSRTEATIASARAKLALAQKVARRDLALGDLVSTETHEQNQAAVATARADLSSAEAARQTAELDVHRTEVHASVNGVVTNLDLHPGDYLAPGRQAMALLDTDSLRVEGYFEENKLARIRIGSPARIRLLGDKADLEGHVTTVAAGIADDQRRDNTGNLLPEVAPTFSWVRLAQRIPVRIHVDRMPAGTLLIVGRTATVTILEPGRKQ